MHRNRLFSTGSSPTRATIKTSPPNQLSIVVPVGVDDRAWRDLLPCLQSLPMPYQVVLSACEPPPGDLPANDGGMSLSWLTGQPGRSAQLNRGIRAAQSNQLWLLHADSRPSDEVVQESTVVINDDTLGWYPLRFDPPEPALVRINALGANLRSRWLGLPFGDQGWRLTRVAFERVGGFDPAWSRGEDLEFAVRARRSGLHFHRYQAALATSPRRYAEHGWWRTTREHLRLTNRMWRDARRGLQ